MLIVEGRSLTHETERMRLIIEELKAIAIVLVLKGRNVESLEKIGRSNDNSTILLVVENEDTNKSSTNIGIISTDVVSEYHASYENLATNALTIITTTNNLQEGIGTRPPREWSQRLGSAGIKDLAAIKIVIDGCTTVELRH